MSLAPLAPLAPLKHVGELEGLAKVIRDHPFFVRYSGVCYDDEVTALVAATEVHRNPAPGCISGDGWYTKHALVDTLPRRFIHGWTYRAEDIVSLWELLVGEPDCEIPRIRFLIEVLEIQFGYLYEWKCTRSVGKCGKSRLDLDCLAARMTNITEALAKAWLDLGRCVANSFSESARQERLAYAESS